MTEARLHDWTGECSSHEPPNYSLQLTAGGRRSANRRGGLSPAAAEGKR